MLFTSIIAQLCLIALAAGHLLWCILVVDYVSSFTQELLQVLGPFQSLLVHFNFRCDLVFAFGSIGKVYDFLQHLHVLPQHI